jgi:tetratricopeptide (TPR) repeat protein
LLKSLLAQFAIRQPRADTVELLREATRRRSKGDLDGAKACAVQAGSDRAAAVDAQCLLGDILLEQGRPQEAVDMLRRTVKLAPAHPDAQELLGRALRATGDLAGAESAFRLAVASAPGRHAARNELAAVLLSRGQPSEASELLRALLAEVPQFPDAHANFGIVLALGGHPAKALPYLDRAVSLRPDDPGLLMNRALCLRELDRHPEAERSLRTALVLRDDLSIRVNLANVLRETGRPREALELVASVASAERETADAKCVMAKSLQDLSELDAAKVAFDAAVATAPEDADVRLSRAMHLLYTGDFGSGWDEYEWRFKSRENPRRDFGLAEWDVSEPLPRAILVYGEQGFGDEIMFASCIPDLAREAERCVLEADPRLAGLLAFSYPSVTVVGTRGAASGPGESHLEPGMMQVAAGSLPRRYRRSMSDFPRRPYLRADPDLVGEYATRLQALGPGLKVGLTWRGGLGKTRRAVRSIDPDSLVRLLALPEIQFVSLQNGEVAGELDLIQQAGARAPVRWPEALADAAETAALMTALDAIVTVCSSVVHLAGALGCRTLVMTPFAPEWRYLAVGERMPWYPSVRLLRQTRPGDWKPVLDAVAAALEAQRSTESEPQ